MTLLAVALLLTALGQAPGAPPPPAGDPFEGFETHLLANGVKLFYRHLPSAPDVSLSVSIPYGHDQDPRGKEELAHFTEHMLFTDHRGRTEEEIQDEIESRGGRRNAFTSSDRTGYWVTIGREHGPLALEWLGRLMEPHEMRPEVVERSRQPVANEIGARPLEIGDRLAALLDPPFLRLPDFWEREFGLATRASRRLWERWRGLQRITPGDLRSFYDRYYVPGAMTVVVVGAISRDSTLAVAERTFGRLRARPVVPAYGSPADPGRHRLSARWNFASRPRFRVVYKVYGHTAEEHVRLLFVRDLLNRRLERRLRFGDRKAVYGVGVSLVERGPASYLAVEARVDGEDLEWARSVVDEELERLRTARWPEGEFEVDRAALAEELRTHHQAAEDLAFLVLGTFADRDVHREVPDLVGRYAATRADDLATFAGTTLLRSRRIDEVRRPHPVGQAGMAAGIVLLLVLSVRGVGRRLTSPVRMEDIRYVARIRLSLPWLLLGVAGMALGGLALLRLLAWGAEWLDRALVEPVDSWFVQMGAFALLGSAAVALVLGWLSLLPRKVLVFQDHVRVKHLSFRSRRLDPDDVAELSLRGFRGVWLSRRIFRTLPFTTGAFRPGILLVPRSGPALFFRSREVEGLLRAMQRALSGEGEGADAARTPGSRETVPNA